MTPALSAVGSSFMIGGATIQRDAKIVPSCRSRQFYNPGMVILDVTALAAFWPATRCFTLTGGRPAQCPSHLGHRGSPSSHAPGGALAGYALWGSSSFGSCVIFPKFDRALATAVLEILPACRGGSPSDNTGSAISGGGGTTSEECLDRDIGDDSIREHLLSSR